MQRDTPLAKERAIPQSQLDNDIQANLAAQAAVKSAQATVETAQLNVGFTKVRSLIDGVAAIATAQIGDLVSPTSLLTTVSQVDPIRAFFSLSEREYLTIAEPDQSTRAAARTCGRRRQGLRLTLADGSVYPLPGTFLAADRQIDSRTGTIRISASFPNPQHILRPGQYGRVRAETQIVSERVARPAAGGDRTPGLFAAARRRRGRQGQPARRSRSAAASAARWIVTQGPRAWRAGRRRLAAASGRPGGEDSQPYARADARHGSSAARTLNMAAFFVRRPIVAIVIAIVTVIAGLVSMQRLPIAQFPNIVPPQIIITATYTGADALTIEQSVATPLEQQVNGVDDMLYMQSTNGNDGTMQLTVTFDIDTDPNIDQVNVQNRIDAGAAKPADRGHAVRLDDAEIDRPADDGACRCSLPGTRTTRSFSPTTPTSTSSTRCIASPGVGEVRIFGAGDYAMRIWVKPDRLAALGLTVPELSRAIQQQSSVNPSGQVGARPVAVRTGDDLHRPRARPAADA